MKKLLLLVAACAAPPSTATTQQAVFSAAPGSFDFGDVNVGTTAGPQEVVFAAAAGETHQIDSIDFSCPDWTVDTSAYALPFTIYTNDADAAYIDLPVRFTPTTGGQQSCVISATDSTAGETESATFYGNGVAPLVALTLVGPTTQQLDFGEVPDGTASTTQAITVRNDGTADIGIGSAGLLSGGASGVSNDGPSSVDLAVGATQQWNVTCTPPADGPLSDTFEIASNDPASPLDITILCTGVTTSLAIAPSPVVFPETLVGGSNNVTVGLTNNGTSTITLVSLTSDHPQFTIAGGLENTQLPPGLSTMAAVTFTPTDDGDLAATLTIQTDTETRNVALAGPGREGNLILVPDGAVDFGTVCLGNTVSQTFVARNGGDGVFSVPSVSATGSDFTAGALSPSIILGPGAPGSMFDVTYSANVAGPDTGMLEVDTDIPASDPHFVQLSALALDSDVAASPTSHDFGPVAPGALSAPATVTVTNCTQSSITISNVSISGGDAAAFLLPGGQTLSGVTVAPGAAASWTVEFAPQDAGARHAVLDLVYDNGTLTVTLDGLGLVGSSGGGRGSYLACSTGDASGFAPVLLALFVACSRRWRTKTRS